MSSFEPTEEQQVIVAQMASSNHLLIQAYAGCSKTTTLELASKQVKVPALALAFNRSIANEMSKQMSKQFKVQTLNGFGFGAWMRAQPSVSRWTIDDKKLGKLVTQAGKDHRVELSGDQWDGLRRLVSQAMQAGLVPGDEGQPLVPDSPESWLAIADECGLDGDDTKMLQPLAVDVLRESIRLAKTGVISFDDQVYCPTVLGGRWPQYPVMFVDESQDLSPLNHRMLELGLRPKGKLVAVGDKCQCHPPGTLIQLSRGKTIPIEELKVGNELVSFNRKVGFTGLTTQGRKVVDIAQQQFNGNLVRISTDASFTHDCTPNHRCMVRWETKDVYCVYLMQKGNRFRIGVAQAFYKSEAESFGPIMRARQEKADAVWVLTTAETKDEALVEEKVIWTLFGLPDLIFKCSGAASTTQANLDAAWARIGDNTARAMKCLQYYNREFGYPFWHVDQLRNKPIGERTFVTEACNVINGVMSIKVFDGTASGKAWLTAWVEHVPYAGIVYGLTVESNGYGMNLYIANGIVTHNSIYAFRGADSQSMRRVEELMLQHGGRDERRLTLTFRCPRVIVERQQEHAPGFRAWSGNAEGRFARFEQTDGQRALGEFAWTWGEVERFRQGLPKANPSVAVLCRNNGPLLALAFKLIRQGTGPVMLGRDIGKGLVQLSRKLAPDDGTPADIIAGLVEHWRERECSLARANGHDERVAGVCDRAECLQAVLQHAEVRDAGQLRLMLEKLFSRSEGQVTLASIHKAKGLEWDLVLHLDPWRIPSKWARQAAQAGDHSQLEQEWNLKYVCETRSKHTLIEANLEDFV